MTFASDDLAQIVVGEDREFVGYAQGILREWDPASHRNVVEVRGGILTDLPVADPIGALTYTPGQVLKLIRWKQRSAGGIASYWIDGSVTFPADGRAEQSIAFMRGQLARQIVNDLVAELLVSPAGVDLSKFVFSQNVHAAETVASIGINNPAGYVTATGGPVVSDVSVSSTGIALVGIQARIPIIASPSQTNIAFISYRVTGATTRAATDANAKRTDIGDTDPVHITNVTDQSMSWSIQSGLNEGLHTFEAMYRNDFFGSFDSRRIIVIAL